MRDYVLVSTVSLNRLANIKANIKSGALHPMEAKKRLAAELADRFCGAGEGEKARAEFEKVFSKKDMPEDMPVVEVPLEGQTMKLVKIMSASGMVASNSEARRLIKAGAVEGNQEAIKDVDYELPATYSTAVSSPAEYILRVGKKRFVKVLLKK